LGLEYLGTRYCGWQRQHHCLSVQAEVESALTRIAAAPIAIVVAGRTDTGVHAVGQVVHFDSQARRDVDRWVLGTNTCLPAGVCVRWARAVPNDFHARYSALWRHYRYVIQDSRARSVVTQERVCWVHYPLDAQRMHEAAQCLLGEHDFSSFRASGCQAKTARRHLYQIQVRRVGDLVVIDVRANAFLHHMVRNIAGALLKVGSGEVPMTWLAELLTQRDRTLGGMTAAAEGLYLLGVGYPDHFGLPAMVADGERAGLPFV
jgi:tRNA pseudouridine38-40 synthase